MPTADGQLTAAEVAQLYALVQAQAAIRRQIVRSAVAAAIAPWWVFTRWYSSADIGRVSAQILRVVQPLQRQAAQVTDAYLARQLSLLSGRRVDPIGVAVDVSKLRRALPDPDGGVGGRGALRVALAEDLRDPAWFTGGFTARDVPSAPDFGASDDGFDAGRGWVDPQAVYGRPADTWRYQVVERQASPDQALKLAIQRAERIAEMDIALAVREQSRQVLIKSKATGYRRVLHPEKSEDGFSCGLCVVAADRIYKVRELLPLHDGCNCTISPILNGVDPGKQLNDEDLARLYKAAGGTTDGRKLQNRVRAAITEHGELGPVLVRSNHKFRSPADVAATKQAQAESQRRRGRTTRPRSDAPADRATFQRRRLDGLEESLAAMERMQRRGDDWTREIADTIAEIERLRQTVPL
jgi:hypothetical protein